MIIFYSLSGAAWITHDCGRSLHLVDSGKKFLSFKYHPSHMQQILALARKECPTNSICVSHNELLLSEDAGKSWRVITSFVYAYEWGKRAEYAFGLGSNAIFATKQDDKSYDQGAHSTAAKSGVSTYLSYDFFKTETRLIQKGYKFWLSKCCIYVEAFDPHGNRLVYTSEVWENKFHWKRMKLIRSESDVYTDFHVLHELDSFTPYLVATRMSASNVLLSDVFKSDYTKANFSKVISNVVIGGTVANPAFQEVPAMNGLYVANVYDPDYLRVQQQMNKASKDSITSNLKNFVKTMISFDHGETWTHIRPPSHNNKNAPYDCEVS